MLRGSGVEFLRCGAAAARVVDRAVPAECPARPLPPHGRTDQRLDRQAVFLRQDTERG